MSFVLYWQRDKCLLSLDAGILWLKSYGQCINFELLTLEERALIYTLVWTDCNFALKNHISSEGKLTQINWYDCKIKVQLHFLIQDWTFKLLQAKILKILYTLKLSCGLRFQLLHTRVSLLSENNKIHVSWNYIL